MLAPIKNLIKEPTSDEKRKQKHKKTNDKNSDDGGGGGDSSGNEEKTETSGAPRSFIKSATDLQRLRLEKLMKNPEKPVIIPEPRAEKDYMQSVPTFVRNVMGSSAGAGSGEFHVYRHLRRKEYARQKTIQAKSIREQLEDEYHKKLEENQRLADEKTAKKRAKRLKKKKHFKKRARRQQHEGEGGGVEAKNCSKQNEQSTSSEEEEEEKEEEEEEQKDVASDETANIDGNQTSEKSNLETKIDDKQKNVIKSETKEGPTNVVEPETLQSFEQNDKNDDGKEE